MDQAGVLAVDFIGPVGVGDEVPVGDGGRAEGGLRGDW